MATPEEIAQMRYQHFVDRLLEGELDESEGDLWMEVYEKVCEMHPSFPDNLFPIGLGKDVLQRSPTTLVINGWGRTEAPTIEALMNKIVRAYEECKRGRWGKFKRAGKET